LFITGASGYVGRQVLERILPQQYERVWCLIRGNTVAPSPNVRFVNGDLLKPETYASQLAECDTVLHLAAVVGKNRPEEYFRGNAEGTRVLVEQAKRAGVKQILHVSTIAVKFEDVSHYPYAQSKRLAEKTVVASGLRYLIVRPTMVIGRGSPVIEGLSKLAAMPVVPFFGPGTAKVQPVSVEDLAAYLLDALDAGPLGNRVAEVGGPEVLTLKEFVLRIRRTLHGKPPRVVHLPAGISVAVLSRLEPALLPVLPVTAGQLAAFTNDGVADPELSPGSPRLPLKTVDEVLEAASADEQSSLDKECHTYSRYLVGAPPTPYVLAKYRQYHKVTNTFAGLPLWDRMLISISARGPLLTRMVDSYAVRFCKFSALRKKLVLMLALLECSRPALEYLDGTDGGGRAWMFLRMGFQAAISVALLLIAIVLLMPTHLIRTTVWHPLRVVLAR
jgi:NADH dehydrogenase